MFLSMDDIIWTHYHEFLELVVSPDDQEVLVVFGNRDMPRESYSIDEMNRSIFRLRLSDGNALQLAPPDEDAHTPCWSPDGCRIAYLSRRSGQTEIWVMKGNGTNAHQVTHSSFPARNPFDCSTLYWSPDGTSIAYTVVPNGGRYALECMIHEESQEQIVVQHAKTNEQRHSPPSLRGTFSGGKCFNQEDAVVFSYQGPTEPAELWLHRPGEPLRQVSSFNKKLAELSEVRIIQYPSDGWMIEALLVLPQHYVPGKKYPTLVYLHGGPESCVSASFIDLISARAQSAAHFLAAHDYAVLLPNFRGSSGYGADFENELGNYQMMHKPFEDVMAGVNYLIDEGIANREKLGLYGSSFGGWLTAWVISQSDYFKGAVAAIGFYDILHHDRFSGQAFYALKPNRLGNADPDDMWLQPEMYKEISPMEHIRSIKTPVLLIETGAEQRHGQARMFFNGLCALGVESYLVYYPKAFHGGGWNDGYKRDYMSRLIAWFDHCLKGSPLPDGFQQKIDDADKSAGNCDNLFI